MEDRLKALTNSVSLSDAEKLADELSSFDDEKLTDEEQQRILSSVMRKAGFEMNETNSVIQTKRNITAKTYNSDDNKPSGRIQLRRGGAVAACLAILLAGGVIFSLNRNMHNTVPNKDRDLSIHVGASTTDEEDVTSDSETDTEYYEEEFFDDYSDDTDEEFSFVDDLGNLLKGGGYFAKSKLKTANGQAKTGYNAVCEYLSDLEMEGKISTATEQDAIKAAKRDLDGLGMSGILGVKFDGDITEYEFHVLWREDENSKYIGRYPDIVQSIDEHIEWDVGAEIQITPEYNETPEIDAENDSISESELKDANANAKEAFSSASAYIAEMERLGKISDATEQEAADMAAQELSELGIKGVVGVKFTGLDLPTPQFYVLWRSDDGSQVIGKFPESPQSLDECPEWDCGASAYVE